MTALQWVYLLSVAGALLFFVAGWIARAGRKPAPAVVDRRDDAEAAALLQREKEVAQAEVQRLEFALIDAEKREKEARETSSSLAEKAGNADQLRTDKERLGKDCIHLEGQLRAQQERAEGLAKELETLRKERGASVSPDDLRKETERREAADKALEEAKQARIKADKAKDEALRARDDATRERDRATRERGELQQKLKRATDDARDVAEKASAEAAETIQRLTAEKGDAEKRLVDTERRLAEATSAAQGIDALRAELAAEREQSARQFARIAEFETESSRRQEADYEHEELQVRLETASAYVVRTKREIGQLTGELTDARARLDQALAKAARVEDVEKQLAAATSTRPDPSSYGELEEARNQVRELRVKVQALESKAAEADRLAQDNARLRDDTSEIDQLRESSAELEEVQASWKQARVQVETLTRRIDELEQSRVDQLALDSRLQELTVIEQEATRLRERIRFLEAVLYSAGVDADDRPPSSKQLDPGTTAGDFEACLRGLLRDQATRSAVLADDGGLLVAGAGDQLPHDAMAAVSGLAWDLASRSTSLLPFTEVESVHVRDANQLVFSCRLFHNEDGRFAVASLGRGAPAPEDLERTVSLASRVMALTAPGHDDDPS